VKQQNAFQKTESTDKYNEICSSQCPNHPLSQKWCIADKWFIQTYFHMEGHLEKVTDFFVFKKLGT